MIWIDIGLIVAGLLFVILFGKAISKKLAVSHTSSSNKSSNSTTIGRTSYGTRSTTTSSYKREASFGDSLHFRYKKGIPSFPKEYKPGYTGQKSLVSQEKYSKKNLKMLPEVMQHGLFHTEHPYVVYKATQRKVVQLIIPSGTRIVRPSGTDKMRAEEAYVVGFFHPAGMEDGVTLKDSSLHRDDFVYQKGTMVVPDTFDPDPRRTCSNGIHFFSDFDKAAGWYHRYGPTRP